MKSLFTAVFLFTLTTLSAQPAPSPSAENIFIITTDGFRWQEVFTGADSAILFNTAYVKDSSTVADLYWAPTAEERRRKLLPFLWNYVAKKGQLWGNRKYENNVSVSNPYRFSYAGYNELLTGFADPAIMRNRSKQNPNTNLLTFLNATERYKQRVAAFGSWKLFSFILNNARSGLPVNCGYEPVYADSLSISEQTVNYLQETISAKQEPTRMDILTYTLANDYIRKNHPRIVYLALGETDEFAHHSRYDKYLGAANQFDRIVADLWQLVQEDDFYKNKTAFFITTDHGRGQSAGQWNVHGPFTKGSEETWFVQLGPGIQRLGEVKLKTEIYAEQLAQTIASYLGEQFTAAHPVAEPAYSVLPARIH